MFWNYCVIHRQYIVQNLEVVMTSIWTDLNTAHSHIAHLKFIVSHFVAHSKDLLISLIPQNIKSLYIHRKFANAIQYFTPFYCSFCIDSFAFMYVFVHKVNCVRCFELGTNSNATFRSACVRVGLRFKIYFDGTHFIYKRRCAKEFHKKCFTSCLPDPKKCPTILMKLNWTNSLKWQATTTGSQAKIWNSKKIFNCSMKWPFSPHSCWNISWT